MSLTYTYKVLSLKVKTEIVDGSPFANTVVQSTWSLTGTDENGNSGTFNGATPFTLSEAGSSTFVPFDELTEDDVVTWIANAVDGNPSYLSHINEQIQKQIDDSVNPTKDSGLPWAPTPEPVPPVIPEEDGEDPIPEDDEKE